MLLSGAEMLATAFGRALLTVLYRIHFVFSVHLASSYVGRITEHNQQILVNKLSIY